MAQKDKTFDCVEMMHRGAKRVQDETRGMTQEEELAYWREGTKRLRKRIDSARKRLGVTEAGTERHPE